MSRVCGSIVGPDSLDARALRRRIEELVRQMHAASVLIVDGDQAPHDLVDPCFEDPTRVVVVVANTESKLSTFKADVRILVPVASGAADDMIIFLCLPVASYVPIDVITLDKALSYTLNRMGPWCVTTAVITVYDHRMWRERAGGVQGVLTAIKKLDDQSKSQLLRLLGDDMPKLNLIAESKLLEQKQQLPPPVFESRMPVKFAITQVVFQRNLQVLLFSGDKLHLPTYGTHDFDEVQGKIQAHVRCLDALVWGGFFYMHNETSVRVMINASRVEVNIPGHVFFDLASLPDVCPDEIEPDTFKTLSLLRPEVRKPYSKLALTGVQT